jgi:hypothetical protein
MTVGHHLLLAVLIRVPQVLSSGLFALACTETRSKTDAQDRYARPMSSDILMYVSTMNAPTTKRVDPLGYALTVP